MYCSWLLILTIELYFLVAERQGFLLFFLSVKIVLCKIREFIVERYDFQILEVLFWILVIVSL